MRRGREKERSEEREREGRRGVRRGREVHEIVMKVKFIGRIRVR